MKTGDLVALDGSVHWNHGCRDYAVFRVMENTEHAISIESHSCHSCWQVGHDSDHIFYAEGDVIDLTCWQVNPASLCWSTRIKWEIERPRTIGENK